MAVIDSAREFAPDYAVPPGETLVELIEERNMSQAELARRTDLSAKHINQIAKGHAPISNDVALRFERVTGVPARLWLNLENRYQERLARLVDDGALERDLHLLDELPIPAMVRMGLLTKYAKPVDRLREVLSLLGVANRSAWVEMLRGLQVSFRMSKSLAPDLAATAIWLRLGEIEEAVIACEPWDRKAFRKTLSDIRSLTRVTDPRVWQPQLGDLCAASGVAMVAVPEVPGARTHGAARWMTPHRGLIQLSIRHKWSDIFWFSFFHEAKHLLDETKRSIFLSGKANDSPEERQADRFAQNFLIPPDRAVELPGLRTHDDVLAFAWSIGVHPGIVVGRLQHERIWPYSRGNDLRQRLRFETRMDA
ncbi:MAG: HigA family addiction module antidote protein [Acidimicrobiia bacterium]|nr:HigA family addiction module antidote protein [Acidimicrobiia bacterium]MYF83058.1 HigA family addiction module antidote protein [Acidimicrobiia bacterium]